MADKVKWGVLGTGFIASCHTVPAMQTADNCALYACASRSIEKANKFKEKFGFSKAYGSYDELINDPDVEAVYIALPNALHKEYTMKCADAGKHVLCEKPLTGTEKDSRELFEYCDKKGVISEEAFAYVHSPVFKQIFADLKSGIIGKVTYLDAAFMTPGYEKNIRIERDLLGGCTYDIGCYGINTVLNIFDDEPVELKAHAYKLHNGCDELTNTIMKFSDGRSASVTSGFVSGVVGSRLNAYGTDGMLHSFIEYNKTGICKYYVVKGDEVKEYSVDCPDNYMLEVEQFARCILNGEKPFTSHDFTLKVARTVEATLKNIEY